MTQEELRDRMRKAPRVAINLGDEESAIGALARLVEAFAGLGELYIALPIVCCNALLPCWVVASRVESARVDVGVVCDYS